MLFTLVGSLIFGWNVMRLTLWIDRKLEQFLDDVTIYQSLGDENEFTDFVLDLRNQRRMGKPVEIKSVSANAENVGNFENLKTFDFRLSQLNTTSKKDGSNFLRGR